LSSTINLLLYSEFSKFDKMHEFLLNNIADLFCSFAIKEKYFIHYYTIALIIAINYYCSYVTTDEIFSLYKIFFP